MTNPLLSFDPNYRRVWMFPRNIRDIAPWKLYKILKVLMQFDDVNQYSADDQQFLYKMLAESGIKREGATRDSNPGGMRTYYSQLETLGLVFKLDNSQVYSYTIAGECLANEDNPLQVLQFQLLRHQYPSKYGFGNNVKIDPRIKVKPFMFILRLLHDHRLEYKLTNADLVFPVIYGHNDNCYEYVVSKILKYRQNKSFNLSIDNLNQDLYTPRGNSEKAINNICDISNTAMNYLKAASLVIENGKDESGKTLYSFNYNYEGLYKKFELEANHYIPIKDVSDYQSFQRAYGRYNKTKDTRNLKECASVSKDSPTIQFATIKYVDYLNKNLFNNDILSFTSEMASYNISAEDAIKATKKLDERKMTLQENTYLDYAFSGGVFSQEFEKATVDILKKLGFTESEWIGRKKSIKNWRGNFPDIYIQQKETKDCGLAETKASSSFSLGHADMLKMKDTYVHSNKEIKQDSNLKYFIYIAGGFKGDISNSISMLSKATSIPVSAIDAKGMIALLHKGWEVSEIENKVFLSGDYITAEKIELS